MKKIILLLFTFVTYAGFAQVKLTEHTLKADPQEIQGEGKITDFSWLTGYWKGKGFGGNCEELWMPARGGQMHGTFRFESEGKLSFAEFMTICRDSSGFVLKLVHFNPDHTTWEDKNKTTDFRFVKAEKNGIWFNGLTMELNENKELVIYLALRNEGNKSYYEEKFVFTKSTL
jgi:hypothetical protein